ncbi:MAG: spore germination protein [Bacillales bacterium]|jgi:spore germination protein KB|nr:spore germination protein [Bacillales bacterium]
MSDSKITPYQFACLVFIFIISSSTLLVPKLTATYAKQDAWISTVLALIIGVFIVKIYLALCNKFPTKNLIEINEIIFGKYISKIFSTVLLVYTILITSGLLRQLSDFLLTTLLPDTPIEVIGLILILLISYIAFNGVNVLAMTTEIIIPFIAVTIIILFIFYTPNVERNNMLPMFEATNGEILKATIITLCYPYLDLIIFLLFIPPLIKGKDIGKAFINSTIIGGIVIVIFTLFCITVLRPGFTVNASYPVYVVTEKINIGNFIQRIESFVGVLWVTSLILKISICFQANLLAFKTMVGIKEINPFIYPVGIICFVLSLYLFPNIVYFNQETIMKIWPSLLIIIGFLYPLTLLIIAYIKEFLQKTKPNKTIEQNN